ncbi:MAG TPA: hypothetical protein VGO07_04945 [Candidatus Saccharimonadales bacterium]|jgi:hypothetical protein|nr:hypothetical protein [Candidatus Saccharimonadales bacterium]
MNEIGTPTPPNEPGSRRPDIYYPAQDEITCSADSDPQTPEPGAEAEPQADSALGSYAVGTTLDAYDITPEEEPEEVQPSPPLVDDGATQSTAVTGAAEQPISLTNARPLSEDMARFIKESLQEDTMADGFAANEDETVAPRYEIRDRPLYAENTAPPKAAAETIFADTNARPLSEDMARFIKDGLAETDIIELGEAAGYDRPVMNLTSQDLETCLPFIARASDTIASSHDADTTAVFAARDGELLYDDYAIAYPDKQSVLLPASMDLLGSEVLTSKAEADQDMARRFFSEYGLDTAWAHDDANKLLVVDTGYSGRVQSYVTYALETIYGVNLTQPEIRSSGVLLSSVSKILPEIMPLGEDPAAVSARLPKLLQILGQYYPAREDTFPDTWRLATALQIMPRFHGHFNRLVENPDGRVVALPDSEPVAKNVDRIIPDRFQSVNTSPVNPVAATVVQFRVVRQALRRTGSVAR